MHPAALINLRFWLALSILTAPLALSTFAVESRYKEYKSSHRAQEFFEISFDKKTLSVTVFRNGETFTRTYDRGEIRKKEKFVSLDESVLFDKDGLVFNEDIYLYQEISDTRITDTENLITITFYTLPGASQRAGRFKQGNRIEFAKDIVVEEDEFVRGIVLTINSDIEVYGEVNKDVISLFGNVYLGPGAVARGDIVSISGRIDIATDASVYGEIYSGIKRRAIYRHRFYLKEKTLSISGNFKYNRVDGATPFCGLRFDDRDSLLPSFWVLFGYAFESERWRYDFSLEQTIWRQRPLTVGGSFYRRLTSDDDWLLTDGENTIFTLLVTEDFKDYYESEGGSVYTVLKLLPNLKLEGRYRLERTKWLKAHRHLWSMFGGDKLFRANFSSVGAEYRQQSIGEINTTDIVYLFGGVEFDTRDKEDPFDKSAWHLTGNIEWSHPDLNSDFDYRRYTLTIRRYQKIHRRVMLLLRGKYGGSDGNLPMYKRFYLGGLGTLRGYRHKELMGSRFWMASAEYRVDLPRTDFAASIFWDAGQIPNDTKFSHNIEVKHCLGIAACLGDDMRINISKRLDRSFDDTPKIYVRFDHRF